MQNNDLIAIYVRGQLGLYGRVENIEPDVKPDWWIVRVMALTIPATYFNWILDSAQIEGEPYSMGGIPMQLKLLPPPGKIEVEEVKTEKPKAKILSLVKEN